MIAIRPRRLWRARAPVIGLYIAVTAASCLTDPQTAVQELDALAAKNRSVIAAVDYRLSWNDGSPDGALVKYSNNAGGNRLDVTYQDATGAKATRTLLFAGTTIYFCAGSAQLPDQLAGPKDECISQPMAEDLVLAGPTAKERGVTVKSRTTKTIGGQPSTCFAVDRAAKTHAAWTECYDRDGDVTYADGAFVTSLLQSLGFQFLTHVAGDFSGAKSIEATHVARGVDPQMFTPPYPVVPG